MLVKVRDRGVTSIAEYIADPDVTIDDSSGNPFEKYHRGFASPEGD